MCRSKQTTLHGNTFVPQSRDLQKTTMITTSFRLAVYWRASEHCHGVSNDNNTNNNRVLKILDDPVFKDRTDFIFLL